MLSIFGVGIESIDAQSATNSQCEVCGEKVEECEYGGDHIDINELKIKANRGDAEAQNILGECYYEGEGVSKDYREMVKWFLKAAEQDLAIAQFCLGNCYLNGEGVPQDYVEAAKWYRKAAEQGHEEAEEQLKELEREGYR